MSLKILMIPFSILMILVLSIGFIKPDFSLMQEKKVIYATKLQQQQNAQMLLDNIGALTSSVESQKEAEKFLEDYVPKDLDQDRVIDMLNFLAGQSGVVADGIALEKAEKEEVVDESTLLDEAGVPIVPPYAVKTGTYSAKVTVRGHYENIKEFFGRVAHMNRLHKTRDFSIKTSEKSDETADASILEGSFRADFDYLAPRPVESALNVPVFSRGTFDTNPLGVVSQWVTNTVPLLEKPGTGRANPFQ